MSASTFPNQIDTFINNLDLTASDSILVQQFFTAYQAGNITLAQQIFNQIPNNTQKILTASKLNKYQDCIVAIENFYQTDIQPYVATKQTEWQGIIDEFSYQNTYNPTTQYEVNNYVTYTQAGLTSLYICYAKPPIGTAPTNTTYWRMLTVRGIKGDSGVGMAFVGNWNSAQTYQVQNCVNYDDALWGALQTNTNQPPYEGSPYWQLVYKSGLTVYPVSATPPAVVADGELWFKNIT
jgi:hypothetical protein